MLQLPPPVIRVLPRVVLLAAVISAALVAALPARAQFWDRLSNPTVKVPVTHPPQVLLKPGQKVAVMMFTGDGGTELSERFIQALTSAGNVEVVDRNNLEAVLREQGLQASGAVGSESAVTLGRLLGAGALFTGRVTRTSVATSGVLENGSYRDKRGQHTKYVRKTTAHITASVQLTDLASGRTYTGKLVDTTKELVTELWDKVPEAPSQDEAISAMYEDAIQQLNRMIFPWQEVVELVVYDDEILGLNVSAGQIKSGDFAGAVQTLQPQLNRGAQTPKEQKALAKVYYNLGIALMYSGNPQDAIPALQKSAQLRPTDITSETIQAAQKMVALNREAERQAAQAAQAVAAEPKKADLTNDQIIEMSKAGLPEAVLIAKIKASKARLDASPEALVALKKAGVSDAVVVLIAERSSPN